MFNIGDLRKRSRTTTLFQVPVELSLDNAYPCVCICVCSRPISFALRRDLFRRQFVDRASVIRHITRVLMDVWRPNTNRLTHTHTRTRSRARRTPSAQRSSLHPPRKYRVVRPVRSAQPCALRIQIAPDICLHTYVHVLVHARLPLQRCS